ncbi:FAD-dependent oxidoreductase [Nocardia blacklockiae]|uniref:FAD-dependent oxidoreductase n=1 Tax=Nocardia blacklockiae TaxID=480036 RepID=UPI0018951E69|nr:FAD-dependent oxidoreductase [Nocardia blacklockiae]MBF6175016.1 FAD-dependent oxidoreductase [Nocardia blacklockiae]
MAGDVAVVGSGISGSAAAFQLHRAGCRVEIIERQPTAGGRFGAGRIGGRSVLAGARLIGHKYTGVREFLGALGPFALEPYPVPPVRVSDGAGHDLDPRVRARIGRHLIDMGAAPHHIAKLTYLMTRARGADGGPDSRYFAKLAEIGDHKPLSAHFGPEIADAVLRPMTAWAHGADPDDVYLGSFGATAATVCDDFEQLSDGLAPVIAALAQRVRLRTSTTATRLIVRKGRVCGLEVIDPDGVHRRTNYDAVVLATPARAAADLVADEFPALAALLARLRYRPATVALVEYDRGLFPPDLAVLALDDASCRTAAVQSTDRRELVRYTFTGRPGTKPPTPQQLRTWLADAERRLTNHFDKPVPTRRTVAAWRCTVGYCGYPPFHTEFVGKVQHELSDIAGLELAGDYLCSPSLEACYQSGAAAAARTVDRLG